METPCYHGQTSGVGSQIKYSVYIQSPGLLTADDVDFVCTFYVVPSRFVRIRKEEMERMDAFHYVAVVDTKKTGDGELKCQVKVTLPDMRTEIETVRTNDKTIKSV